MHVYANAIYLAEALAQAQHRIVELEGRLVAVRCEIMKPGDDLQVLCERVEAVISGHVPVAL